MALGERAARRRFFVRFAWSEPAACFVRREASVLAALAQPPAVPFLPTVVASGTGPLIVVTRRVRGSSLFDVAGSIDPGRPWVPGWNC